MKVRSLLNEYKSEESLFHFVIVIVSVRGSKNSTALDLKSNEQAQKYVV